MKNKAVWTVVCMLLVAPAGVRADSKLECYKLFYDGQFSKAYGVCEVAASQGHAYGKYLLGVMKAQGRGGPKDEAAGVALITQGAEAGISDAQRDLASAYQMGMGTQVDLDKAFYWYKKSAASNNLPAMLYLGGMYISGQGTPSDLARGYAYVSLAADRGNENARQAIAALNSQPEVTPEVKKQAKRIYDELSREIKK